MANAGIDGNSRQTLLCLSSANDGTFVIPYADPTTHRLLTDSAASSGTVTTVSVATANGFSGTVANPTTTPAITMATTINSPVLAGNGTALSAANTTGSGSTVVLGTGPSISGAAITTSTVNGVTLTTGGSASAFLNGAGSYTTPTDTGITQLTGDVTAGPGSGSQAATLATVNSNVGTFGSATKASVVTVNAKGLVTAASESTVTPAVGSITGLGTGVATFLATPSSANLAAALTDETGSGAAVFANTPTLVTPVLGAATATSITTSGANQLGVGSTINMLVPTSAGATGPTTNAFNSGYSSTAVGDLVYLDSSTTWQKADADLSTAAEAGMLGIALTVTASGAAATVALPGSFVFATAWNLATVGAPVYMSATAGAITLTAPTTTDSATRVIGWVVASGNTTTKIWFQPSPDYITHV